ncbi:hypothetical protein [Cohnella nanjingensis]|uniref:Uncharacterized protein n=1 Tax=Cohnella nanjingensis TaxID=1387779 RepID=A0A7X0RKM1_9BACL|nr:hypothetical protein [Cohnella nanjingensis]MBB6669222.1 hypothetical protein [Cohnella nanjingensis]
MPDLSLVRFAGLRYEHEENAFRDEMLQAGYYAFFAFLEEFRAFLRAYGDDGIAEASSRIALARRLFPEAERISPSWARIWTEFERIAAGKNEAMAAVSPLERPGEWQVLIDNPHLPQQVVCYPDLAFLDAAYAYGYFSLELKPNENLKLQKTMTALLAQGDRSASLPAFD